MWKEPNNTVQLWSILLIVLMLGFTWHFVYLTGGTKYVYLHLMYFPIICASFIGGVRGGISTAIVAGILLGPLMPLDVENNIRQPLHAYIYRTAFFILIAFIVGYISNSLKLHLIKIQQTLDQVSFIQANTLKNYANMVSIRDEQTAFHCERVAYNALMIGHALGLNKQKIEALYWSGLLHDVGKIGVKEKILLKPDKLTDEEFEEIKRHTVFGYDLVNSLSNDFHLVAKGIRSHHEKWNGAGYPDGLKGKEIPIFGRILSVVDVFEALTSERPYKDPWEPDDVLDYIIKHKEIYFDPEIVDIFKILLQEGKIWISNQSININENIIPLKFNKELID